MSTGMTADAWLSARIRDAADEAVAAHMGKATKPVDPDHPVRNRITTMISEALVIIVKSATATVFTGLAGAAFNKGLGLIGLGFADTPSVAFDAFAFIGFGIAMAAVGISLLKDLK